MHALVCDEGWVLGVRELSAPAPLFDEVLVRVEAAGICGSDVGGFASRSPRRQPPLIMGHELVGTVVRAGSAVGEELVGQRVAVNPQVPCRECADCRSGRENVCRRRELIGGTRAGGLAELISVPLRCAHPVRAGLSPRVGVFAEPLATCVHGLSLVPEKFPETAVVLGAGTIGLLAAQLLRLVGAGQVIVSEFDEARRREARSVADETVAPDDVLAIVQEVTSGSGAALSVDAVGSMQTRQQSLEVLGSGGTALWLGMHEQEGHVPAFELVVREQSIRGAFAYTDPEFRRAVGLLERGLIVPAVPFRSFPLAESSTVFQQLLDGATDGFTKAVIEPELVNQP